MSKKFEFFEKFITLLLGTILIDERFKLIIIIFIVLIDIYLEINDKD